MSRATISLHIDTRFTPANPRYSMNQGFICTCSISGEGAAKPGGVCVVCRVTPRQVRRAIGYAEMKRAPSGSAHFIPVHRCTCTFGNQGFLQVAPHFPQAYLPGVPAYLTMGRVIGEKWFFIPDRLIIRSELVNSGHKCHYCTHPSGG